MTMPWTEEEGPCIHHRSAFDTLPCPPPAPEDDGYLSNVVLAFPGGQTPLPRPTKAQLQDSALAWLALAQTQLGSVRYWAEQGDRTFETMKSLQVLASQIEHVRRALNDSELVK